VEHLHAITLHQPQRLTVANDQLGGREMAHGFRLCTPYARLLKTRSVTAISLRHPANG
jgi:hypothetical protein